ncbi:Calvin cycle protein CP12-2, chloroplastic-like protein [Drosera capensis]
MASISGIITLSSPYLPSTIAVPSLPSPTPRTLRFGARSRNPMIKTLRAAPEKISQKVEESVKQAEELCADDPVSGECVAAWDEVEELSAAASHARDRKKETDVLETFCKDNPSDEECRTYED